MHFHLEGNLVTTSDYGKRNIWPHVRSYFLSSSFMELSVVVSGSAASGEIAVAQLVPDELVAATDDSDV